jgi:AcrR family transcriptional regulator
MPRKETRTRERILLAALALFGERGIAATSLNEVAERAGVTRVTVYRHFADKEELAREAFLHVEQAFVDGVRELKRDRRARLEDVMNGIGERLSHLPLGDAFARTEELKRLYPAAYAAVQDVRVSTLNELFNQFGARARREGRMRPGLNHKLFQAVYWELTIHFFDNPRFRSLGLSDAELYRGMMDILLHGALGG